MATPTIPNGEEYFFPIIYEGNGAGQRVGKFVPFTDNGTIANSVIFNSPDDPKLGKTFSGAGTNTTWTFSCWIKLGIKTSNGRRMIFSAGSAGSNYGGAEIGSTGDDSIEFYNYYGGSYDWRLVTNRQLEDTSKWYHLLFVSDTTNSTESDRARIYIDGERVTSFSTASYPSLNYANNFWMGTTEHEIGTSIFTTQNFDGYMAEVNNVDGSVVLPSTFGLTDTSTGRWIPKTLSGITYGTNGFRFTFADSSAFGDDTSGNTNDFTATNLATTDQTTDSPTQNFATGLGAFQTSYAMTMSEGNLKSRATGGSGQHGKSSTTLTFDANDSNGYYAEYTVNETSSVGSNFNAVGITVDREAYAVPNASNGKVSGQIRYMEDGRFRTTNLAGTLTDVSSWGSTWGNVSTPDIIGIFVKNNKIYFSKNGTWQNSADPDNETGGMDVEGTIGSNRVRFSHIGYQSASTGGAMTANFGQKSFTYTPPTGYKTLNQDNLPTTDRGITGMVWIKNRDETRSHVIYDSSRGPGQKLQPDKTNADTLNVDGVTKFLKGGVVVGSQNQSNDAGDGNVAWNWVANGGTTATNEDGSISSTVQANTTAGFSIVQYTGTGSNATVGHGLSSAPEWILIKDTGNAESWIVSHKGLTSQATYSITLNNSNAESSSGGTVYWNSTAPTSSVFSLATDTGVNGSSRNYVAYCWHGVDGFSKFGYYSANANADGPFIYTGFKPSWVMIKRTDYDAQWFMFDNKRNPFNPLDKNLRANQNNAESTTTALDFVSNGFKIRHNASVISINDSGGRLIYMAFAEHPFVGNGTSPVTAG